MKTNLRIGEVLMERNYITQEQMEQALAYQKEHREKRVGQILIELGFVTEAQVLEALAARLGLEIVSIGQMQVDLTAVRMIPRELAEKQNLLAVGFADKSLEVVTNDPLNYFAFEEVRQLTGCQVVIRLSEKGPLQSAIRYYYAEVGAQQAAQTANEDFAERNVEMLQVDESESGDPEAPIVKLLNSLLDRAISTGASDVHIEPFEGSTRVRMRIDGILRKILTVPANLQSNVISRLKIMGGMNISERKIPQDGRAMVQVRHHEIDLRISSMPTIYGEKIVLRLLDKSGHTITKQSIGLEGTDLQKYDALLKNSSGVILIVGPTGSGKSTTMCAMLQELANEETNLMTLEDPVEYNIPGVNQCQINEKTGMTFAAGLRAILRQDPDVISVGEIRDGETGAIAIRAAITGHLVLSTLHTNDAVSAIDRLVDIGVEPYLISSALRGVISQRLVRKVCPHCKKAYRPEAEELAMLGLPEDANVQFYRGEGCQECYHTGYKGRRAVFEIFMLNGRIRRMVTEGAKYDALLRAATETNFVTMRENCRNLVLRGEISAAEAARAINSTAD